MEFEVYIRINKYDGGTVLVEDSVTEEEVELLKKCYKEDIAVEGCDGLEDLVERLTELAIEENEECLEGLDEEEIDYDECDFIISIPDEICVMIAE